MTFDQILRDDEPLAIEARLREFGADSIERVHFYAAHGRVLLQLANGDDVDLASSAATHLANALSLARRFHPECVADIKVDLYLAEHVIATRRAI